MNTKVLSLIPLFLGYGASEAHSQELVVPTNVSVVEAYIDQHKAMATAMGVREAAAAANKLMHDALASKAEDCKDQTKSFERYIKAFDALEAFCEGAATVVTTYETVRDTKNTISEYLSVLNEYREYITEHGIKELRPEDAMIVDIAQECIGNVRYDVEAVVKQVAEVIAYIKSKRRMTTSDFSILCDAINTDMIRIAVDLDKAYRATYRYVKYRKSLNKKGQYHRFRMDTAKHAADAHGRWASAAMTQMVETSAGSVRP